MILARGAWLAAGVVLVLLAGDGLAMDGPASAFNVMVASVVALLAPLFWPGTPGPGRRGLWLVLAWCLGATALAALLMLGLNPRGPRVAHLAGVCGQLLLLLLAVHLLLASLLARWGGEGGLLSRGAGQAGLVLLMALMAALPLWLGPAVQGPSAGADDAVDLLLALSPLVHLAVAAGNDLLRNGWFYEHSNLAGLPFSYPEVSKLVVVYAAACLLLSLSRLRLQRPRPEAATPIPERSS